MAKYSYEFKRIVVDEYLSGQGGCNYLSQNTVSHDHLSRVFASNNSKKLHPKMEKVASPFWRKLQAARQGCQSAAQTALQTYH